MKMNNAQIRSALITHWKKKVRYHYLHIFVCGKHCDTCKSKDCKRVRSMPWCTGIGI